MEGWNLENSPSSRAQCRECQKSIKIRTPRWKVELEGNFYFGRQSFHYYHYMCGICKLEDIQDSVRDLMHEIEGRVQAIKGADKDDENAYEFVRKE